MTSKNAPRLALIAVGFVLFVITMAASAGANEPSPVAIAPPKSPSPYALPADARVVSNAAQLVRALRHRGRDIVLADGVYDSPVPFVLANGAHLYAQHVGRAILTAGLVVGGNRSASGAVVQGVAFDLHDATRTLNGAELALWGAAASDAKVLDCTFEGNWQIPYGLVDLQPTGLVVRRIRFRHFGDGALRVSDNDPVAPGTPTPEANLITDISVSGVSRRTPGSSQGTAESGIWIGQPIAHGVHRVRVRDVAWAGIETVNNAYDTTFTDIDVDLSGRHALLGVAFYLEHYSRGLVINGFTFTSVRAGFTAEWDDPAWGGVAAAHDTTIRNGVIDASGWTRPGRSVGVFLDQGTDSTTVSGVTFAHMNFAGIAAYNVVGRNRFGGNRYRLPVGVPRISTQHI